jgi:uncharacterized membrane protein
MQISDLAGLPAHPLIVHAAVVLLPLAVLVTIVAVVLPTARRHYAPLALALAVVATIAVGLAQGSGEQLEDRVTETELVEQHASRGEHVLPWAVAVTVVALTVTAAEPLARRYPGARITRTTVTAALLVAAVVTGVGATWVVVDVGHSGAAATWTDVGGAAGAGGAGEVGEE